MPHCQALCLKSAGLVPEDQPAWGHWGWATSLGSFCHKHYMKSWGFYHWQLIIMGRSFHDKWLIMPQTSQTGSLQTRAQCWAQLPCFFHCQLHPMSSIAMFAQSSSRANKPWRSRLALCHTTGWHLYSHCPQICWRNLCTGRPRSISAESVSTLQGWHWLETRAQSTSRQFWAEPYGWGCATHPHCSRFQLGAFAECNAKLTVAPCAWCRDAQVTFQGQLAGQCNTAAHVAALE